MSGSISTYANLLVARTWRETNALFFRKSWKVFTLDVVLLLSGLTLMYMAQAWLVSHHLISPTSVLALNKALPVAFSLLVFIPAYAVYFAAEFLVFTPYRLWIERTSEPPASAAAPNAEPIAPTLVDDDTKRLAGVVMALRDRVLVHGFKTPVVYDDPYFGWLAAIETSTHPIWIDDQPRADRIDFVQAAKVLPALNRDHAERTEIDHWRQLAKARSDTLIQYLRG